MSDNTQNIEKTAKQGGQVDANVMRHVAWACKTCNKIDWIDSKEALAKPEHVPHRGVDIGTCKGKMIKLYAPEGA